MEIALQEVQVEKPAQHPPVVLFRVIRMKTAFCQDQG